MKWVWDERMTQFEIFQWKGQTVPRSVFKVHSVGVHMCSSLYHWAPVTAVLYLSMTSDLSEEGGGVTGLRRWTSETSQSLSCHCAIFYYPSIHCCGVTKQKHFYHVSGSRFTRDGSCGFNKSSPCCVLVSVFSSNASALHTNQQPERKLWDFSLQSRRSELTSGSAHQGRDGVLVLSGTSHWKCPRCEAARQLDRPGPCTQLTSLLVSLLCSAEGKSSHSTSPVMWHPFASALMKSTDCVRLVVCRGNKEESSGECDLALKLHVSVSVKFNSSLLS